MEFEEELSHFDAAAERREVASGLLVGAVQFWLYAHQPCGDPGCESCAEVDTAEKRLQTLTDQIRQSAMESDYYHTRFDANVGSA